MALVKGVAISRTFALFVVAAGVFCSLVVPASAVSYTFTTIDVPGAIFTQAFGINTAGQIVGDFGTLGGCPGGVCSHGFLRDTAGTFTPIDVPGATFTEARSINTSGQIVGHFANSTGGHGFLRDTDGTFTTIDVPGAIFTRAFGINDAGQIVGDFFDGASVHGFLRDTDGTLTTIDVPGATETQAFGINASGQIVGGFGPVPLGFLRDAAGTFTTIVVPGATTNNTMAFGINAAGHIVGVFSNSTGQHGFLRDIAGSFTTIDVPGAAGTQTLGINAAGQIVGLFFDSTGQHGFLATPEVSIDIKPGSFPNSINPKSKGKVPVAILTTATFDATTVDPSTVLFGATGTEAAPVHAALEDVDGDGDTDIILHFNTQDTGIVCGDTSASLTGETVSGQGIEGSDSIKTVGCK